MRPPVVEITAHGVIEAAETLGDLGVRASDARRVASRVKAVFSRAERDRFNREGPGWPPLAASTRARKERQGQDARIMRATGTLYRSLTSSAQGSLDVRRPTEFRFGTDLPYAVFHEEGKGVPTRDLIELGPRERREIAKVIEQFIAKDRT